MKSKLFLTVVSLFLFLFGTAAFFIANKVLADTVLDTIPGSQNLSTIPVPDQNIQKPILTISVEAKFIKMNVTAVGAKIVTIYNKNSSGEIKIFTLIRLPDGNWSISLSIAVLPPGTYSAYAVADSGTSVFGQSNIESYTINIPPAETMTTIPSEPLATVNEQVGQVVAPTQNTNVSSSSGATTQTQSTTTSQTSATTSENQSSSSSSSVESTIASRTIIDITTLPEKFAKSMEQIKSTKTVGSNNDNPITIESIKNTQVAAVGSSGTETKKDAIIFSGKAKPNSIVYLYIFSDPIVVSVKADENGNWQYILDRPLDTGKHESYILVEDSATKEVLRTEAKDFFISKARASSSMLDIPGNQGITLEDPFTAMVRSYAVYVGIIVSLAVLVVLLFGLRKFKKAEEDGSNFLTKSE